MKFALCQMKIELGDRQKNMETAMKFLKQAVESGADVLLYPELTLTGFDRSVDMADIKEKETDSLEIMRKAAAENNIVIGFGWAKDIGEKSENHYTVINTDGGILADYTKIHPYGYGGEADEFVGGDKLCYFELGGFKVGIAICYDIRYAELFCIMAEKVDMIIVPGNWPRSRGEFWFHFIRGRAVETQSYILGIDCVGKSKGVSFAGGTCITDPVGNVLNVLRERQGLVIMDLNNDVQMFREAFPISRDRRRDLYPKLMQQ